ncbi:MAG: hydrogenase maturation nickel metallochaperone HypA, partial [bacterium]|nr:hydrogenase maturation nickel metallochaperone HypA [bacterium]
HDGCAGSFENGKQVVDKIRMMGFNDQLMPMPVEMKCEGCGKDFTMEQFETKCPECGMVYGVTPCHAYAAENIMPAGVNY